MIGAFHPQKIRRVTEAEIRRAGHDISGNALPRTWGAYGKRLHRGSADVIKGFIYRCNKPVTPTSSSTIATTRGRQGRSLTALFVCRSLGI